MSQMEKSFASNLQPRNCQFSRAELWEREIFLVAVFFFFFFRSGDFKVFIVGEKRRRQGTFFFQGI